jgi:hypothetical protein
MPANQTTKTNTKNAAAPATVPATTPAKETTVAKSKKSDKPVVATAVVTPAPVEEATTTKKNTKKTQQPVSDSEASGTSGAESSSESKSTGLATKKGGKKTTETAPVVVVPQVVDETPSTSEVAVSENVFSTRVESVLNKLKELKESFVEICKEVNELTRLARRADKNDSRQKKRKGERKASSKNRSGIMQPHPVSDSLRAFMKKCQENDLWSLPTVPEDEPPRAEGTYSRVDALKAISAYVKKNKLQDAEGRKYINLDSSLTALFPHLAGRTGEDRLQYTGIMPALGSHFPSAKTV